MIRPLGHGGMGTVYLALRQVPFKRYVALKVVREEFGAAEIRQRFEVVRTHWLNLDVVWAAALMATACLTIVV